MKRPLLICLTFFMSLVFVTSCYQDQIRDDIRVRDFFHQVIGAWQVEGENSFEEWKMAPDSTFTALAYATENGDTLATEHIRIVKQQGMWFYEATVNGQNDDRPVLFDLVELSDSLAIFRNDRHDSPKEIRYMLQDGSRIKATISGTINGESRS